MSRLNYMAGHYTYKLWAAPWNDNQSMVRPARLTPVGGARNVVRILREDYFLPTVHDRYHCYMVGQTDTYLFNINPEIDWKSAGYWYNLADYCRESDIIFQFYTKHGVNIPLSLVYFTVTEERNFVFVIKEEAKIKWNMDSEDITFRTYRSIHLSDSKVNPKRTDFDVLGKKLTVLQDKEPLFAFWRKYLNQPLGVLRCYVNGYHVDSLLTTTLVEGDFVEVIYDSTIERVVDINLSSLNIFESIRDGIRKYLFSRPTEYQRNMMDFYDDIDFYLIIKPNETPKFFKGISIHRNSETNIRQITNSDFAISVNHVQELMTYHREWLAVNKGKIFIRAYVHLKDKREAMPFVSHRLHDLNRLPYPNKMAALTGFRSNIKEWRADVLENSELMRAVAADKPICTIDNLEKIYGYNGLTYYMGKSVHGENDIIQEHENLRVVNVPYNLRKHCSTFEYDENGVMLGWVRYADFNQYPIHHPRCKKVEFIGQVGTRQPDDVYDTNYTKISNDQEFRVYVCDDSKIAFPDEWEDVTNSSDVIRTENTDDTVTVKYTGSLIRKKIIIRKDRDFLCREVRVPLTYGVLTFRMNHVKVKDGQLVEQRCLVPYGYYDVFLNGHALIEGIDYFVDFPNVTIVNKEFFDFSKPKQDVMYRCSGFCNKDMSPQSYREVGYVHRNQLSRDGYFDVLEDKNLLIKVNGGIYTLNELGFSELETKIPEKLKLEGKPYEIRDVIVPKRLAYPTDTYVLREEAIALDKKIGEYLTQFKPEPKGERVIATENRYKLFCPLLSRALESCLNGSLDFNKLEEAYNNDELIQYVENKWSDLFKADPYLRKEAINLSNIEIHPTWRNKPVRVNYYHYQFLRRLINVYYRDEISLSHFVSIGV